MPPDFLDKRSFMPVSTAELALKDLQKKQKHVDEISRGIQEQSLKRTAQGSYVKPVAATPTDPIGSIQSISL